MHHMLLTNHLSGGVQNQIRKIGIVVYNKRFQAAGYLGSCANLLGAVLCDFLDSANEETVNLHIKGSDRAKHICMVCDYVLGRAAFQLADGVYIFGKRIHFPRQRILNVVICTDCCGQSIYTGVGQCCVSGSAVKVDSQIAAGCHGAAFANANRSGFQPILHMHTDNDVDFVHQAAVDQFFSAASYTFLAGLENQHHSASELVLHRFEGFGRAEKHSGMGIVAAGMHLTFGFGFERQVGFFFDQKRIHICANANGKMILLGIDGCYDTGLTVAFAIGYTKTVQLSLYHGNRLRQVKSDFGIFVNFVS